MSHLDHAPQASNSEPHASADELALFVLDALELPARRHLERHVALCATCARALAAEAAAEVALSAAWPDVPRPLAAVLSLPVRTVAPAPPPAVRLVVPLVAPRAVRARPASGRHALAGNSWSNGLAAAVLTVLFVGYWNDGSPRAPRPTSESSSALRGDGNLCLLEAPPPPLLLASVDAPSTSRMCAAPNPFEARGGLCQESPLTCAP